jgi:hypothetical protein
MTIARTSIPRFQLARSLDDPARLAQPVNLTLWEPRLEHGPYIVAGHGLFPLGVASHRLPVMDPLGGE